MSTELWLACAQASNAAYEIDATARAGLLPSGMVEKSYLVAGDARALVATWNGKTILAFQGTQFTRGELPSIFANLEVDGLEIGGGRKVTAGYWGQLQNLMPLLEKVPLAQGDIITGHSMGGSIAELYASSMPAGQFAVISIAAPKVGNLAFWDAAPFRPARIVRERDFAPIWPILPDEWEQPPGGLEWLHRDTTGTLRCEHVEHRPIAPDSIPDHSIDLYIADLEALAKEKP